MKIEPMGGLTAPWQLAIRALNLLCAPPFTPALSPAYVTLESRKSLPNIVERYATPPLVGSCLLIAAQNGVDENGNNGAVEELCTNPVVISPKNVSLPKFSRQAC